MAKTATIAESSAGSQEARGGASAGPRVWLGVLASLLRLVVGAGFLLAAGAKLSLAEGHGAGVTYGLTTFAATIAGHKVVPEGFQFAAAVAAVAAEVLMGLWLLSHRRERLASALAIVMLAGFCAYLVVAYVKVGDAPCGCMGKLTSGKVTDAIVRNAGLVAVLLPSVLLKSPGGASEAANARAVTS